MLPYLILACAFIIALLLIFKKNKPKSVNLSKADLQLLEINVAFYFRLDGEKRKLFEQKVANFLATIKIEGVGVTITRLDELLIAASAVIPIFGFDDWQYKNLGTVLLYPDTFNKDFAYEGGDRNIAGMVGSGYMNGQMILSQNALRQGFTNKTDKENTAIHEFVHLLDKADGATDGVPSYFMDQQYVLPWVQMMHHEIQQIALNKSDINPYAITNEAEFFAVVAEYFFEKPETLKEKHPDLYHLLSIFFSQNPAQ